MRVTYVHICKHGMCGPPPEKSLGIMSMGEMLLSMVLLVKHRHQTPPLPCYDGAYCYVE